MPTEEARLPRPGEHIGRYEVVAPVGRGGMAAVYAVRLGSIGGFGKILAMKVLLPQMRSEEILAMFLDEARIAAQIQHPNVAQLFELGEHEGSPFMVMELLRGRSLAQVADRAAHGRALEPAFVLRVLADVARGLHAAHETRGEDGEPLAVVHRDVSPQNVHVGYDGVVKVVDFGIARARGRITHTQSGTVKGKLRYLAPEQLSRSAPLDRRVDVWALGVMAWELLARERLFRDEDEATTIYNVLHKDVPPLRDRVPAIPPEVDAIVNASLTRDVAGRPATADAMARVLDAAARELGGDEDLVKSTMDALFAADRERSELHIAAAVRELEAAPGGATVPDAEVPMAEVPAEPRIAPPRRARWAALAVLAVLAVLAGTWLLVPSDDDAAAARAADTSAAARPAPLAPTSEARAAVEPAPQPEPEPQETAPSEAPEATPSEAPPARAHHAARRRPRPPATTRERPRERALLSNPY